MEIIKKILDLKNITEHKNSIESFKNRLKQTEERINELEDKSFEIIQSEYQKENRMKKSGGGHLTASFTFNFEFNS